MRSFRSPSSTVAVTPGTGGRIPSTRASKLVEIRPELTWAAADAGLIAAAAAHAATATDSRTSAPAGPQMRRLKHRSRDYDARRRCL